MDTDIKELWRDIDGYENFYQVSNFGRVYSFHRNRFLSTHHVPGKYIGVILYKHGVGKSYYVHRLVAEAFIPNLDKLPFVNHKDENPANNRVDNLEWCTNEYNLNYGNAKKRQALSQSTLSDKQKIECYKLMLKGYSMRDLGKKYGVSIQTISRLLTKDKKHNSSILEGVKISREEIKNNGKNAMGIKHRKLSDDKLRECYFKHLEGLSLTELSSIYGVSIAALSNIFNGKTQQSKILEKDTGEIL